MHEFLRMIREIALAIRLFEDAVDEDALSERLVSVHSQTPYPEDVSNINWFKACPKEHKKNTSYCLSEDDRIC